LARVAKATLLALGAATVIAIWQPTRSWAEGPTDSSSAEPADPFEDPIWGHLRFARKSTKPGESQRARDITQRAIAALTRTAEMKSAFDVPQVGTTARVYEAMTHSRGSHMIATAYLGQQLVEAALRHSKEQIPLANRVAIPLALGCHDLGHRGQSHEFETWLAYVGVHFHHEAMTRRILTDPTSEVHQLLDQIGREENLPRLREVVISYLDPNGKQGGPRPHLAEIVSSQVDADRLHYLFNDEIHAARSQAGTASPAYVKRTARSIVREILKGATAIRDPDGQCRLAFHRETVEPITDFLNRLATLYERVNFAPEARGHSVLQREAIARAAKLHQRAHAIPDTREREAALQTLLGDERWFDELLDPRHGGDQISRAAYLDATKPRLEALFERWVGYPDAKLSALAQMIQRGEGLAGIPLLPEERAPERTRALSKAIKKSFRRAAAKRQKANPKLPAPPLDPGSPREARVAWYPRRLFGIVEVKGRRIYDPSEPVLIVDRRTGVVHDLQQRLGQLGRQVSDSSHVRISTLFVPHPARDVVEQLLASRRARYHR
jgi:HD superfamily phosphohydrolase